MARLARDAGVRLAGTLEIGGQYGGKIRSGLEPLFIKNALTGFSSRRSTVLSPVELHGLLCKMVGVGGASRSFPVIRVLPMY